MSYASEVLADSPLLYWPFNSGGTDASGNSRTASGGVNGTSVAGLLPSTSDLAVAFNGSTQYLTLVYGSWMNVSAITLEVWVQTTSTAGEIIASRDNGTTIRPWQLKLTTTGKVDFVRIQNAAGTTAVVEGLSATSVNDGVAHHVVATYDGTTCLIYIDGALDSTTAISGGLRQPTSIGLDVARYSPALNLYYAGTLDELAWYGTALSATRVAVHYAAGTVTGTAVTASIGGSGAFSATVVPVIARTAAIAGSGTFTAIVATKVTASLGGSGAFTAVVGNAVAVTASIGGSGAFTATVVPVVPRPAALGGSGAFSATVTVAYAVTASLGGSGAFTAVAYEAGAAVPVDGNLGGSGAFSASVTFTVVNLYMGRRREAIATPVTSPPVSPPLPSLAVRYDRARALPTPTMVDGTPT